MRQVAAVILLVTAVAIPMFFQNCSTPIDDSRDPASIAASSKFAFDSKVDHVAYMSCVGNNSPDGSIFSLKVGAYGNSAGIMLTPSFRDSVRNLDRAGKLQVLQESTMNSDSFARVQMMSSGLEQFYLPGFPNFYHPMIGNLTTTEVANQFFDAPVGTRLKTVTLAGQTLKFEGSVQFVNDVANNVLTALQSPSGAVVALAYGAIGQNDRALLQDPDLGGTMVFGRGYKPTMTTGFALDGGDFSNAVRAIGSMTEVNLVNAAPTGTSFTCPNHLKFMVVRALDAISAGCNASLTPAATTSQQQEALDALNRILPQRTQRWKVDLARRCIVHDDSPSNGYNTCYGAATSITYRSGTCSGTTCPHYLTICKSY